MNAGDRQLLIEKCAQVLHRALVEIRNLSRCVDNTNRIHELADIIHNLPLFQVGRDEFAVVHIRENCKITKANTESTDYILEYLIWTKKNSMNAITVLPGIGLHRKNSQ